MIESEAFKLTLVGIEITGDLKPVAVFDLRIRTDNTWMYAENLRLQIGSTLYVRDGQDCDYVDPPYSSFVRVPRGAFDRLLEDHG